MLPTLGARIRRLREQKDLTQKDLGKIIGFTGSAVTQWEAGKRIPDPATLDKLATYFDTRVDYLLGRTDEPRQSKPVALPDGWTAVVEEAKGHGLTPDQVLRAVRFMADNRDK